jgi:hypothetical protein
MKMEQYQKRRVGIANPSGWTVWDSNFGGGKRFYLLHTLPDQSWDPLTLLYNECWGFTPGVRSVDHSPLSSVEVKNE